MTWPTAASQQMTDPPSHPADLIGFLGSQRDELGPNYQPRHQSLSSIHLAKPVKRYLASKDKAIELMLWASTKRCSSDKTWGATCWWLEERATTGFLNHQQYITESKKAEAADMQGDLCEEWRPDLEIIHHGRSLWKNFQRHSRVQTKRHDMRLLQYHPFLSWNTKRPLLKRNSCKNGLHFFQRWQSLTIHGLWSLERPSKDSHAALSCARQEQAHRSCLGKCWCGWMSVCYQQDMNDDIDFDTVSTVTVSLKHLEQVGKSWSDLDWWRKRF